MKKEIKIHKLNGEPKLIQTAEHYDDGRKSFSIETVDFNKKIYEKTIKLNQDSILNPEFDIDVQCFDRFFKVAEISSCVQAGPSFNLNYSATLSRYTVRCFDYNGREVCKPLENATAIEVVKNFSTEKRCYQYISKHLILDKDMIM